MKSRRKQSSVEFQASYYGKIKKIHDSKIRILNKKLPHRGMAERNLETSSILLLTTLNDLTITDRQADRKATYRGTSLRSAEKMTNMDLGGALKSALQGPF